MKVIGETVMDAEQRRWVLYPQITQEDSELARKLMERNWKLARLKGVFVATKGIHRVCDICFKYLVERCEKIDSSNQFLEN